MGRRGFLDIRPRRWWLRPRGGHAHGKRGTRVVGDGDGNRHGRAGRVLALRSTDVLRLRGCAVLLIGDGELASENECFFFLYLLLEFDFIDLR